MNINNNSNVKPASLDDIQNQVTKLGDMLKERYNQLEEAEKKLENEKEKFDAAHKMIETFKDPIKLNIGGKIFMTSKSTLLKEESMLAAMFSGRHELQKGDDGAYFIDRDPKHFGKILNFLRDGEFELNDNEVERKEMLREAEYYSLIALLDHLQDPTSTPTLELAFDLIRKGKYITVNGATARSNSTDVWQPAFTANTFSRGVHSCTFSGTPNNIIAGISGANVKYNHSAYTELRTMMLNVSPGQLFIDGVETKPFMFDAQARSVTIELDCDERTVTWIRGTDRFQAPIPTSFKAPFSFCVDLWNSAATIIALN
jgi:hypothetical protein